MTASMAKACTRMMAWDTTNCSLGQTRVSAAFAIRSNPMIAFHPGALAMTSGSTRAHARNVRLRVCASGPRTTPNVMPSPVTRVTCGRSMALALSVTKKCWLSKTANARSVVSPSERVTGPTGRRSGSPLITVMTLAEFGGCSAMTAIEQLDFWETMSICYVRQSTI